MKKLLKPLIYLVLFAVFFFLARSVFPHPVMRTAAMLFGGASAAAGALARPMQDMFRIRDLDIRTAVCFTETKPTVFARIRMSVSLGALLWVGLRGFVKLRRAGKNKTGK